MENENLFHIFFLGVSFFSDVLTKIESLELSIRLILKSLAIQHLFSHILNFTFIYSYFLFGSFMNISLSLQSSQHPYIHRVELSFIPFQLQYQSFEDLADN